MSLANKMPQGTIVEFEVHPVKGRGKICGIATTGAPIIGVGYIVELLDNDLNPAYYPYTHMVVYEAHIKKVGG